LKHKTGKSLHNSCYRFMTWRKTNRTWCSCISTNARRNYDALWSRAATRSRAWPWRIKPITACLLDYALFSVSVKTIYFKDEWVYVRGFPHTHQIIKIMLELRKLVLMHTLWKNVKWNKPSQKKIF